MTELFGNIMQHYPSFDLINVFTGGPTSQFKRYLFSNLAGWEKEFSVKFFWNFFATSHGNEENDAIGGTVKIYVWRHVRTTAASPVDAESYAKLDKELNKNIIFYVSSGTIATTSAAKLTVWENSLAVPNTMKMHCIKVCNSRQLEVSKTSVGETFKVKDILNCQVLSNESDTNPRSDTESCSLSEVVSIENANEIQLDVYDCVLVCYGNETFPRVITKLFASDVEVNVMHKSGASYWKWPTQEIKN